MPEELKEVGGNFPTFASLEEVIETNKEEATDNDKVDLSKEVLKSKEDLKVKDTKVVGDTPEFEKLDLSKTEDSADDEEEVTISAEKAIENFNIAKALGTLITPDDFVYDGTPEAAEKAVEFTRKHWEDQGKAELLNKMQDPYLKEIVNYGLEAGSFADLDGFKTSLKEHLDASKVDLTNVDQAKSIVEKHLKATGVQVGMIKKIINLAEEDDELEQLGVDAKNYFIAKAEEDIIGKKQKDFQAAQNLKIAQAEYENKFMESLKTKELMAEDRNNILNAFNNIEFQNGSTMPEYQYKLEQIKQNPSDFIDLLKILGKYEAGKGFNLDTGTKARTEKVKSVYDLLNGNTSTITKSASSANIDTGDRKRFIPTFEDTTKTI